MSARDRFPSSREEALQALASSGVFATTVVHGSGTVDAKTDVVIPEGVERIPVRFNQADADFYIRSPSLSSFEGSPRVVKGSFGCAAVGGCGCSTGSLSGSPLFVGRAAFFTNCRVSSMVGCPLYVGVGGLYLGGNRIESVDAAPVRVDGLFDLSNNRISSLRGVDRVLTGVYGEIGLGANPIRGGLLSLVLVDCDRFTSMLTDPYFDAIQIVNRHLGHGRKGLVAAQREMLDAGLDEYAEV